MCPLRSISPFGGGARWQAGSDPTVPPSSPALSSPPPGAHVLLTPGAAGPSALSAQLASALPPLPAGTQLQDNTLALLHHMALATGTHAVFILSPGTAPLPPAIRKGVVGVEGPPLKFLDGCTYSLGRGLFVPSQTAPGNTVPKLVS